jgi:PAS domain S-box-containing protein
MEFYRKNSPWILAILFLSILIWGSFQYLSYKKGQWEKDIRNQTLENLISKKSRIEKALYSRIYYTRGVAAFVSLKPTITNQEYDRLASEFIQNDSVIITMSLAKNCIIGAVYPLEGHEKVLGLDLMSHPERKEIVNKTIESRKTFVAGPVELVEGGAAFISYTPIFDTKTNFNGSFWGVTDIVIDKNLLFEEAGLHVIENSFVFALKGENGTGKDGSVFWGDSKVFEQLPVEISIELPYGSWLLAAVPISGWSAYYDQDKVLSIVLLVSSLIISILLFLILHGINKIRYREREFKAIFNSMDTLVIEFNKEGEYFKIAPTNHKLLAFPAEEVLGKKIEDLFEPDLAKLFIETISKCIQTKEVVVIDYPLDLNGVPKWFRARVSYKSGASVIFNIYDITIQKLAEDELQNSELNLKKMNNVKDRFFSVIAHDLRNPIASFENLTELILDPAIPQTKSEQLILIKSINETASGLSDLLENLLSWAQSQQNIIYVNSKQQHVCLVCKNVVDSQKSHAIMKNISIDLNVDPTQSAFFDSDLTTIIFRNLISNALKYSFENSTIAIKSEIDLSRNMVLLHIIDNGIGIPKSNIDDLFKIEKQLLKHGTKNEKGSGLGLVLCKEFAALQSGEILVKSEEGKGSTFSLLLPLNEKS